LKTTQKDDWYAWKCSRRKFGRNLLQNFVVGDENLQLYLYTRFSDVIVAEQHYDAMLEA